MEILTIMVVRRTKIQRYGKTIVFKDEGLKGYTIEFTDLEYDTGLGFPYVRFRSFDDHSKFFDIDCWLHFLYSENSELNTSLIRDGEKMFYNNLKEVEKIVDYCKNMKIETNGSVALYMLFRYIDRFVRESEDGFKHENKKLEKKVNKLANELEELCEQ